MKTPRPVAVGLFALSALLLSGCSPEAAVPSAPPAAEGEALFASDEEALAAAEAAWSEYASVANTVFQQGGAAPERIRPYVSDEVWESDLADAKRWQSEGLTSIGRTELEAIEFQQRYASPDGRVEVVTYNCLSVADVDVVDANGESVVSPERAERYIVEAVVSFEDTQTWTIESYEQTESVETCA